MKLQVIFTVDVDWCDEDLGPPADGDPLCKQIEEAVAEAIAEALQRTEDMGYNHSMSGQISILVDSDISVNMLD